MITLRNVDHVYQRKYQMNEESVFPYILKVLQKLQPIQSGMYWYAKKCWREKMNQPDEDNKEFREIFLEKNNNQENISHSLIVINKKSIFEKDIIIGLFSKIFAQISGVIFSEKSDTSSFFSINDADSHKIDIGRIKEFEGRPVIFENHHFIVFFYCFIKYFWLKNHQLLYLIFSNRNYRCGARIES